MLEWSEWELYKQEEPDIITCNEIADVNLIQLKGDESPPFQNVKNEITNMQTSISVASLKDLNTVTSVTLLFEARRETI